MLFISIIYIQVCNFIIQRVYKKDFALFGYSLDPLQSAKDSNSVACEFTTAVAKKLKTEDNVHSDFTTGDQMPPCFNDITDENTEKLAKADSCQEPSNLLVVAIDQINESVAQSSEAGEVETDVGSRKRHYGDLASET